MISTEKIIEDAASFHCAPVINCCVSTEKELEQFRVRKFPTSQLFIIQIH